MATVLTWSGVSKSYYDVARTMGATPWFLVRKVAVAARRLDIAPISIRDADCRIANDGIFHRIVV